MRAELPRRARLVWWGVLLVAIFLSFAAYAAPEAVADASGGMPNWFLLVAALVAMIVLGSPLFVIVGVLAGMMFLLYSDFAVAECLSLQVKTTTCRFEIFPNVMVGLAEKNVLLAIPFFLLSGAIMSAGDIANRLVAFAKSLIGWVPGGLAAATVGGCVFFAAISGSSPVTVIAIGSMMYPALVREQYKERFSMGLVTSAGSLGILIPPSIPMIVFAIAASGSLPVDITELFMAGFLPGMLIGGLFVLYSALFSGVPGGDFDLKEIWHSLREGFWAVMMPPLILGGIWLGVFTATEAAAVSVVYALVVELFIHRQITVAHLPKIISESSVMMGSILIIMALAFGLNQFIVDQQVADKAVELIDEMELTPIAFLLIVNVLLLLTGALMDSISAILVIAPLLTPIGIQLGVDPVHLGVIFIVNLEIGYLTPPIGINLFVASIAFEKSLGDVIRSVVPFIALMLVGLGIVTYVPSVAMGPVNALLRGESFYEPLPERKQKTPDDPLAGGPASAAPDGKARSMQQISNITAQLQDTCYLAEDILDDEDIEPADRIQAWTDGFEDEEITDPTVLEMANKGAAAAGQPGTYDELKKTAESIVLTDWDCPALKTLLGPSQEGADAKTPE